MTLLANPIEQDDTDSTTLGAYLADLLVALLQEEEGFSGKRPLGNSGWRGPIEIAVAGDYTDDLRPLGDHIRAALTGGPVDGGTPSVARTSIEVYEDVEEATSYAEGARRFWVARLDGPLSTGEEIALQREAPTAAEAIAALEAAIAEQGWEIR